MSQSTRISTINILVTGISAATISIIDILAAGISIALYIMSIFKLATTSPKL